MTAMPTTVSIVGLGAMGSAFARAFLADGHSVTVWNRSPARAEPFVEVGAQRAGSVAEAVAASPLVVVIVSDYAVARELLGPDDVAAALDGRVLVNLTSDDPKQATAFAALMAERGARYLDGRVGCYPREIGTPHSNIIYAGDPDVFQEWEPVLRSLGSDLQFVGADIRVANALAVSMYSLFHHAILIAYYEAAAMAARYGSSIETCLPLAQQTLRTTGEAIVRGTAECAVQQHDGSEATLATHADAVMRSRRAMLEVDASHTLADVVLAYLDGARAAGHGDSALSALYPMLRDGAD